MSAPSEERINLLREYVEHGLALVHIPKGRKCPITPGWNDQENAVTDPGKVASLNGNVGLAHAYCTPRPTVSLDVDDLELAVAWLLDRGVDLDALLNADDGLAVERADGLAGEGGDAAAGFGAGRHGLRAQILGHDPFETAGDVERMSEAAVQDGFLQTGKFDAGAEGGEIGHAARAPGLEHVPGDHFQGRTEMRGRGAAQSFERVAFLKRLELATDAEHEPFR